MIICTRFAKYYPSNLMAMQNFIHSATTSDFNALTCDEMFAVDQLILAKLCSKVELINKIGCYIIGNGGKRLRPLLLFLTTKALGYGYGDGNENQVMLATVIEFLHTASLLHDDVIDEAALRRGRKSANLVWGNAVSVLVGDFFYANAFQMVMQTGDGRVMDLISQTVATLTEGEVLQLVNCNNPDTTEAQYFEIISRKTAILFETSAHLAALISNATPEQIKGLTVYGLSLGMAFQLIDDVLDYTSNAAELGKNLGNDLAEGKTTLPLIYAMQHAQPDEVQVIFSAIKNGSTDAFKQVYAIVMKTDAITYTIQRAEEQAEKAVAALVCLSDSIYKDALIDLAIFSVQRNH